MADPPVPQVNLSDLGPLTRIGSGGQGTVFALTEDPSLVYKEYAPRFVDDVDVTALGRFVQLAAGGAGSDAEALLGLAAWPTAIVRKGGVVRGFLMPRVPQQYTVRLDLPGGPATVLAQLQYLLNGEDYLRARGLHVDDRLRLEVLRDTGAALATLHRLGVCVGDFSPHNLLFSATARPRCYFIDCDAMRLDGESVLGQAETPEWQVPDPDGEQPAEELATPATDAYKFGLLVVRLFAGDQQVRDPAAAGPRLRGDLRRLAGRSLSADPAQRPAPERWIGPLETAIARTPATPPPPPPEDPPVRTAQPDDAPAAAPPRRTIRQPRPPRQPALNRGWLGLLVPAVAILIGVIVGLADGGSSGGSDTPVAGRTIEPFTFSPRTYPTYTVPDVPNILPSPPILSWLDPTLPKLTPLCVMKSVEIGPGLNPKGAKVKQAADPVFGFTCSLTSDDREAAFSGRRGKAPDATQRSRYAKLAAHAPYEQVTIIGVRTGPGGVPQVNVVFQPLSTEAGAGCWRSRLSLAKTDDGYGVSALTAPAAVSCG